MSFNSTKKRAQDFSRHINSRRVSVRSCIQLCLYYSGLNGYNSLVEYYNETDNLNTNSLTSETIDKILLELTELREKSKQLKQEYFNYRKKQKKQGQRGISKNDGLILKENWKEVNQLWDKFDTDENRNKKKELYTQRKKEIERLMNK